MPKRGKIEENIKLLCSVSEAEEQYFTERQIELINLLKSGVPPAEIPRRWECSRTNVYTLIVNCAKNLGKIRSQELPETEEPSKKPNKRRSKTRVDYQKFANENLSALTDREREILKIRIDRPNLTVRQIADMCSMRPGTCAATLNNAVIKLNGEYGNREEYYKKYRKKRYQKNKEKIKAQNKEYYKGHKERHKELREAWRNRNREKILEHQRQYNKIYYQQHREELVQKARERRQKDCNIRSEKCQE